MPNTDTPFRKNKGLVSRKTKKHRSKILSICIARNIVFSITTKNLFYVPNFWSFSDSSCKKKHEGFIIGFQTIYFFRPETHSQNLSPDLDSQRQSPWVQGLREHS